MWLAENEGAKFWQNVLTELKKSRSSGYTDSLRERPKGLPRRDKQRLPVDLYPYGAQQLDASLEGLQGHHRWAKVGLSGPDRRIGADGDEYVRG